MDAAAAAQFLYREARLLDERRFGEWLALLSNDCEILVPTRDNLAAGADGAPPRVEEELAELAFFEDNKLTLLARVLRLGTGRAWGENPPSRTRRIVTNVELEAGARGEWIVHSNLLLYRTRRASEENWFVGARRDLLREDAAGVRLARRRVVLDTHVLDSPNLSVFL